MRNLNILLGWLFVSISLIVAMAIGDSLADSNTPVPNQAKDLDKLTFVRVMYDSTGGFGESWYRHEGRTWQRWETDFPRAESNLMLRLDQLTSLNVNPEPIVLRLTDDAILDHPFIFMSDVGWQKLSRAEINSLEAYLRAGGFLWVDDFWGDAEWDNFQQNIGQIGDGWQWKPVPKDHPIMTIVYQVETCPSDSREDFLRADWFELGSATGSSVSIRRPRGREASSLHGAVRHKEPTAGNRDAQY